jgi:hypothetical protein
MPDRHNPPRGWRGAQTGGAPASGASYQPAKSTGRGKQIFGVLAVMVALAGAVAGIVYWLRPAPRPYFVPLFIPEYTQKQVPVNFQAETDRRALEEGNYFEHQSTFGSQERDSFMGQLAGLKSRPSSDAVVLYVCAFARASEKGEVLLLPGNFNPDDSQTAVRLREALERLRDCPSKNKLLILDTMRPLADSRLGVLANDVAARVVQELKDLNDPHRITLLSCSPGQVSLGSEDLGRSVFGYYLEEGLRGWADGWDADRKHDGHVSARELAEFVKRRVDRWADQNRGTRQTPLLLPKDATIDFQLVALKHGEPEEELTPPDPVDYPDALKKAWQVRDAAWDDLSLAPRAFRELEAYLLRAELQWRGGMDLKRLEQDLRGPKGQLDRFEAQLKDARKFFLGDQPEPRSLTLARALGQKPEPAVADALKALVANAADVPKEKQPEAAGALKDFLAKNKGKPFDVSCAAFDLAANDANLTTDKVRFLAQLLKSPELPQRYVETVILANSLPSWPPAIARQALDVVKKGETALSRPQVLPWLRLQIEEAAQDRHIAEVYLASPGCVSVEETEKQLQTAAKKYKQLLENQGILLRAQGNLDEALVRLPAYLPYLEATIPNDNAWRKAAQFALELREALIQYPKQKLSDSDLSNKLADINQKTENLRAQLDGLRRPFNSDDLQRMFKLSGQADANPSLCREIEAMLSTPMLKTDDRIALWKSGRALSAKLNEKTMMLDHDEDHAKQVKWSLSDFDSDQDRWQQDERGRAAHRARWAIALLKLSGLPATEARPLEESLSQAETKSDTAAWDALAASLRKAWVEDVYRRLKEENNLAAKDRLNVPCPPFDIMVDDRESPNDFLLSLNKELKQWLTQWYDYESQDLPSSGFYVDAARDYRADGRLTSAPRNEVSLQFDGPPQIPSLTPENPSADITLKLKLSGGSSSPPIDVNILTADDQRLQVIPDKSRLPSELPIHVTLKTGAQNVAPPPGFGFLVQAHLGDRVFHHRVSVPLTQIPEIILSTNPTEPKDPVTNQLSLRPGKEPLKYYLYVSNPTKKPQKLVIELLDNEEPIEGGVARIPDPLKPNDTPLQPNKTRRLDFGKPVPDKPLKDFHGPLKIRLRDADANDEILDTKKIDVSIAAPREYVEVKDIQFEPAARKLMMKVQAKKDIPEGCQVDLVLPTDGRIPGYTGVAKDRKDSEKLTNKDEPKELSVSGIQLDEGSDPNGYVYLAVDGVERAFIFQTTFKRNGAPTTPEPFEDSDIRIQAPAYAIPSDKFTIKTNVDNPPDGATVLVELGKELEDGSFDVQKASRAVPARDRHLGISAQGGDGALLFQAQIGDPVIPLDTRGIAGKRVLRASLRDRDDKLVKPPYKLPITLDDTAPDKLSAKAEQVGKNMVQATAEGQDEESEVKMVRFYVGKLDEAKKLPAGAAPLDAKFDSDKNAWTRLIPVTGPEIDLIAEFENGVHLKSYFPFKATMNVSEDGGSGGGDGGAKPGSISGSVELNNRTQKDAKVTLEGGPLKKPLQETTNDDGEFKFKSVPPGTYKLTAVTKDGRAKGSLDGVTVEAGKAKDNQVIKVKR